MTTSTEFFINNKSIPTLDSKEYDAFFAYEQEKINKGVTINGINYPPWLYWHLNHWKILIDKGKDPVTYKVKRGLANPKLRDNEWIISENIEKANRRKNKKGLLIVGTRRYAKTEIGASYIAYNTIDAFGSENMCSSSNDPDLNKIASSLKRGYKGLHPYFKPIFLEDSWKAGSDVVLGFKDRTGERYEYSRLLLRNHAGGKNTEGGAGATLNSVLIDEIGKSDWLEFLEALKPGLESEFGWRCSPIATGTTGNMEKAKELMEVYGSMEEHEFIKVELKDDRGNQYSFFPGMMSLKFPKTTIKLKDFLGKECDNEDTIKVTQWQKAEDFLKTKVKHLENKNKHKSKIKTQMYYPTNEDEMFLTDDSQNPYADVKPYAQEHLKYLESINLEEKYGFMIRDFDGKPKFVPSDKKPILDFPTPQDQDKDAPIIIWAEPLPGQEFGILHVSGADPVNQDESFYSSSLSTLYIYRRTYDPINGKAQESFVAAYVARPTSGTKWFEQVRLLLEYYGATCLPENEDAGLIRYFDSKNLSHHMEDGLDLAKEINPKTETKRKKGLGATLPNIRHGNGLLRNYCLEDLVIGQDPQGQPIIKKGITRIKCRGLLREIIAYREGLNVDRIVGARHALIIAEYKNKYYPIAKIKASQPIDKEKPKSFSNSSPFSMRPKNGGIASHKKNPFGLKR